jgi:DNA-binding transcriptional regulator YbjK
MSSVKPPRETTIAEAALEILGSEGPRGLTHRAVDRRAGLPEGSTSNLFRTRAALLGAVNEHLAASDAQEVLRFAEGIGPGADPAQAAGGLAAIVRGWTVDGARTAARLELFLEARRQPALAPALGRARSTFAAMAERLLAQLGCSTPAVHAVALMALVEGLVENQLLHPATRLGDDELREVFAVWLSAC